MRGSLRKGFDAVLGAAVSGYRYTRERAGAFAETGRESRERIRHRVDRETETWRETGREEAARLEEQVRHELDRALQGMQLVTRSEYEALERELTGLRTRVANLEAQLNELLEDRAE